MASYHAFKNANKIMRSGVLLERLSSLCKFSRLQSTLADNGISTEQITTENSPTVKEKISGTKEKKPIWYYENKGIRMRKIQQVLRRDEESFKDDTDASRRMHGIIKYFRTKQISEKDIASMLFNKPRILELSRNKISHRFQALNKLDFVEDELIRLIIRCPGVLLVDMAEELKSKMDAISNLQCHPKLDSQKVKYIIHKCPDILLIRDTSTLSHKVDQLYALGFNAQQVYELLIKHPKALTYSQETVARKVTFVVETLNGRLQLFVKFPRVFTCSLMRIKERHAFLLKEGYMKSTTRLSENKLRSIVLTTDKDFVYRVTNTKMKEYRKFQRDFRSDAVKALGDLDENDDFLNDNEDFSECEEEETFDQDDIEYGNEMEDEFQNEFNIKYSSRKVYK